MAGNSPQFDADTLRDVLSQFSNNANRYKRPRAGDADQSAEDAIKQYEQVLSEETSLRNGMNKALKNGWTALIGLPRTLNSIYKQIESDITDFSSANKDAVNRIQKETIAQVKQHKLNSKHIKDLSTATEKVVKDMQDSSVNVMRIGVASQQAQEKFSKINDKVGDISKAIADKTAEIKASHKGTKTSALKLELAKLTENLKKANTELELADDEALDAQSRLIAGQLELAETLEKVKSSKFFDSLAAADQLNIQKIIDDPAEAFGKALADTTSAVAEMGETFKFTIKSLSKAMEEHVKSIEPTMKAFVQKIGAMAVISGKGILDSYYAQLSANLLESTPGTLIDMGMTAGEQADIIKQYGRELASATGQNDMSKAYDQQDQVLDGLQRTALLFGVIGKEAHELSLRHIRMVNMAGAGTAGGTANSANELMSQISSSASFLRQDKTEFSNEMSEIISSGLVDTNIQLLKAGKKDSGQLTKALVQNYAAIKGNTMQLGFSNTYAKEQIQLGQAEKYKDINQFMMSMLGGKMEFGVLRKDLNLTEDDARIMLKERTQKHLMSPEEITRMTEIRKSAAEYANRVANDPTLSQSVKFGVQKAILAQFGRSVLDDATLHEASRAQVVGDSIAAQTTEKFSPVLNLDDNINTAAGSTEKFNNALIVGEEELTRFHQWAKGIAGNPYGNVAGSAIGLMGDMASTVIGAAIGSAIASGGVGGLAGATVAGVTTAVAGFLTTSVAAIATGSIAGIAGAAALVVGTGLAAWTAGGIFYEDYIAKYLRDREDAAYELEQKLLRAGGYVDAAHARIASGRNLTPRDMQIEEYEKITGNKITKDRPLTPVVDETGSIMYYIGDKPLSEGTQKALEDAVYARQAAMLGDTSKVQDFKDMFPDQRRRLMQEQLNAMQNNAPISNNYATRTGGRRFRSPTVKSAGGGSIGSTPSVGSTPWDVGPSSPSGGSIGPIGTTIPLTPTEQAIADIKYAASVGGISEDTLLKMGYKESRFNPLAANRTPKNPDGSSASGLFQFLDDTWVEELDKHGSKYGVDTKNMTRDQKLALKTDSKINALMGMEFTKQNMKTIGSEKLGDVYAAHHFGPTGAINLLAGQDPVTALGGREQYNKIISQNPQLRGLDSKGILDWANTYINSGIPSNISSMINTTPPSIQTSVNRMNNKNNANNLFNNPWESVGNELRNGNTAIVQTLEKINVIAERGNKISNKIVENTTPTAAFADSWVGEQQGIVTNNLARARGSVVNR